MSSIKKWKKKEIEIPNVDMNNTVPDNVKVVFGKFYVYSLIYILFFGILFPFILLSRLDSIFSVVLVILLSLFYIYIVVDTKKKTMKYISNLYVLLIIVVLVCISFSIIKMVL